MTEVGIQSFAAGHSEKHRPQNDQSDHSVSEQELDCENRIDRVHNAGIVADMHQAHHAQCQKPDNHDRSKGAGDHGSAPALDREQTDQDHNRHWDDDMLKRRRCDLQTFYRREH